MEPTLTGLFGAGASQTSTLLTLLKADLIGLTASANNTGEGLLVALLLLWEAQLTPENQTTNAAQSIRVERGTVSLTSTVDADGVVSQWREIPFTVTLRESYVDSGIDPDKY
jgi:hypothetical protein